MQKIVFFLLLLTAAYTSIYAQSPTIFSIDKKNATVDQIITISGRNFGNNTSNIKVFFGAAEGKVISVNDNLLKAKVPSGATYSKISITNISTQLTGYSSLPFYPSFDGSTFNATHLSKQNDFLEEDELFDVCVCDFDRDGFNDIGTTNNSNLAKYTSISIYRNNSTPANISFQTVFGSELNVGRETRNITCGDLNGDGKPELIVSQGGNAAERIYVFKNLSTGPGIIQFEGALILSLEDDGPTNGARRVVIEDLDRDGKPEIIVSNQNVKQIVIFGNESENGLIRFPLTSRKKLDVPGNTLGLAIQDLDGDMLPEIVTGNNLSDNIYCLKNKSFQKNIAFDSPITLNAPGLLVNLIAGDIDGDGKPDLAATDFSSGNVLVFLNQTNSNTLSFTSPQKVLVSINPWGLDIGDINGDGKADLAISSSSASDKNIILLNNSSAGYLEFQSLRIGNKEVSRNIKIADFNGDAKPDISFTTQKSDASFYFSTLQNTACVYPEITPNSPDPVCAGVPVTLYATKALNVTYQWQKDGTDIPGATESQLEVSTAGNYSVTIESAQDGCSQTSASVTVTEKTASIPPTPTIQNTGNVCESEQMQLSPTSPIIGATYYWQGPNGFSYMGEDLTISQIKLNQSGEYSLQAEVNGCKSDTAFTQVTVNQQPNYDIVANSSTSFCTGESVDLMVADEDGLQYQWYKDGQAIQDAKANLLNATESGSYHVSIKSSAGCTQTTSSVNIQVIEKPNVYFSFTSPKQCIDEEISFTNETVYNTDYPINYDWDFGNGKTSSEQNPSQIYDSEGTFTVKLIATYDNLNCYNSFQQDLDISDLPQVNILVPVGIICEGDSVLLELDDTYASVSWFDGSTGDSLYAFNEGTYEVTVTNDAGCENSATTDISQVPRPEISVSADKTDITSEESVNLVATGGTSYLWTPADNLNDNTIDNPVATPQSSTVYTVIGTDMNGCIGKDSIKINVEQIVNITPKNMFSPNNDGVDDYWEVNNIESFPDCKISIFTIQGRNIYESQPYLNDWDGIDIHGKPLDEGVYYYTIRCSNKNEKAGSITLIR